jgi:hypothetical protein
VGRGWWREMKRKVSRVTHPVWRILQKRNQQYCILVVFKLPDCTSNNTYGELRFNILYLELCQFVGGEQLGKALAYCFFKSIGFTFYWNSQIPFIVIHEQILWKQFVNQEFESFWKDCKFCFKAYKFVYKILHMVEEYPWWEKIGISSRFLDMLLQPMLSS